MLETKRKKPALPNAMTGAMGVHFVAAELSRRGVVALPTIRNTKGFDIVTVSQDGRTFATVQVKASLKRDSFWLVGEVDPDPPETAIYALVRLAANLIDLECWVVPAGVVAKTFKSDRQPGLNSWAIPKENPERFLNRWDLIPGASATAFLAGGLKAKASS